MLLWASRGSIVLIQCRMDGGPILSGKCEGQNYAPVVHPFDICSCYGRVKFLIALRTIDWSTSQLSLVCKRATASNEKILAYFKIDNLRPKLLISKQAVVNLELPITKLKRKKPTLERQKEGWTSIYALMEASDSGWTGYVCVGLDCQQLHLLSFSCESMPMFEFDRALIYFKPWKAFEQAELWLLLSERGRSG
ncbi:unnamed protein product [Prunus armeniaca]